MKNRLSRRTFITNTGKSAFLLATSSLIIPRMGLASPQLDKKIALYNIHTGEWFKQNYVENGNLIKESIAELQRFLRDHRTQETHPIDIDLIHLVHHLQQKVGPNEIFDVISGYRSPSTNAALRNKSTGVARNSYHMKGQAVDIRSVRHLQYLRDCARSLKRGGVGYYQKSGFIHVDVRKKPAYWVG